MSSDITTVEDITEEFLMLLLCQVGEARSACMQAMSYARQEQFEKAQECLALADDALINVHKSQTSLIGFDEGAGKVPMTLILTHIQDHIMTTMLCRDLADEVMVIHKKLEKVLKNEKAYI